MAEINAPKIHIGKPTLTAGDGGFGKPGLMSAPLIELTKRLGGRIADIEKVAGRGKEVIPNLITILQMGTDYNKACALACLLKMEERGVEFGATLGIETKEIDEVLEIMDMRAELIPALRETLKGDNEYVKGYSATMLAEIRALEAIPKIAEGLGSRSHMVRWRCAAALVLMGEDSVKAVAKRLNETNSHVERREARRVLLGIEADMPGSVPKEIMDKIAEEEREAERRRMGLALRG